MHTKTEDQNAKLLLQNKINILLLLNKLFWLSHLNWYSYI